MLKEKRKLLMPVGSVMRKDDYWPYANQHKLADIDVCGFLSIHHTQFFRSNEDYWTIVSPLYLVDNDGKRPNFEEEKFNDFTSCLMRAIELSLEHQTFVVIVDDPITNKTMQPSRAYPQV